MAQTFAFTIDRVDPLGMIRLRECELWRMEPPACGLVHVDEEADKVVLIDFAA